MTNFHLALKQQRHSSVSHTIFYMQSETFVEVILRKTKNRSILNVCKEGIFKSNSIRVEVSFKRW